MATIVKGASFSGTVTAGGMHTLVESATISAIDRASLRTTEIAVATQSPSAPSSPTDKELWQAYPSNGLASYDLANLRWNGALPTIRRYTLSSLSAAVVAGNTLISDGLGSLDALSLFLAPGSAINAGACAVALHPVSPGGVGLCVIAGPAYVACTGTITAGQSVKQSTTPGAVQSAALGAGAGWEFIGEATVASSGGFVWSNLRR